MDVEGTRSAANPEGRIITIPCKSGYPAWEEHRAHLYHIFEQQRWGYTVWNVEHQVEWLVPMLQERTDVAKEDSEWYTRTEPEDRIPARNQRTLRDMGVVGRNWRAFLTR